MLSSTPLSGQRQGDPLSPALFVLLRAPLVVQLQALSPALSCARGPCVCRGCGGPPGEPMVKRGGPRSEKACADD